MDSSNSNNYSAGRKESGIYGRRSPVRSNNSPVHSKVDAARLKFKKEKASSTITSHRAYEKRENASKRFKSRRGNDRKLKVITEVADDSSEVITFVKSVDMPVDIYSMLDEDYMNEYNRCFEEECKKMYQDEIPEVSYMMSAVLCIWM